MRQVTRCAALTAAGRLLADCPVQKRCGRGVGILKCVRHLHVSCKRASSWHVTGAINLFHFHLVIGSACRACRNPPAQQLRSARRALPGNLEHVQYKRLQCSLVPSSCFGVCCSLCAHVEFAVYECWSG
jgi:hypothetical protein